MAADILSFLTFNIGNPSVLRAQRQFDWLANRPEDVLVLTETKASAGCQLLADSLGAAGWHVAYPQPEPGGYGAMIVSRVQADDDRFGDTVGYLSARAASVTLPAPGGPVQVIGAYVPSRDAGWEKTERKRKWLAALGSALAARDRGIPLVFLGDLNVLEPDHDPRYPFFVPFEYGFYRDLSAEYALTDAFRHLHPGAAEYSWVGRTGDGYRYDHAFCSASLAPHLVSCGYLHDPRHDGLSDHSALAAAFAVKPPPSLLVAETAAADSGGTLF